MKNWRHFSAPFATTNHGEFSSQVNQTRSKLLIERKRLDLENFSLSATRKKTWCNIYRSVEKENSRHQMKKWLKAGVECSALQQQEFGLNSDFWEIRLNEPKNVIKSKPNLRSDVIWKLFAQNFCSIARDTSVPPKLLRIAAGGEARCPTSFVNDLVLPVVVVPCNRMEKWLFSDYPSIPLAESKCWTPSRTFFPRISPKRPLPLPHQRRNQRRTGSSHLMGNFSFPFVFST